MTKKIARLTVMRTLPKLDIKWKANIEPAAGVKIGQRWRKEITNQLQSYLSIADEDEIFGPEYQKIGNALKKVIEEYHKLPPAARYPLQPYGAAITAMDHLLSKASKVLKSDKTRWEILVRNLWLTLEETGMKMSRNSNYQTNGGRGRPSVVQVTIREILISVGIGDHYDHHSPMRHASAVLAAVKGLRRKNPNLLQNSPHSSKRRLL